MANGRHSTHRGEVQLPRAASSPLREVGRRVGFAVSLVVFVALIVLLGRDGYVDDTGDQIGFLDSLYYASVTVTTTGYGDITAVSDGARLATIALITPARIVFLILVVGTTVEVLTDRSGNFFSSDAGGAAAEITTSFSVWFDRGLRRCRPRPPRGGTRRDRRCRHRRLGRRRGCDQGFVAIGGGHEQRRARQAAVCRAQP